VSPIFSTAPEVADPGEALAETAAASDPGARLADFNPPQKGYRALREALMTMEASANGAGTDAAADDSGDALTDTAATGDDPLFGAARPRHAKRRAYLASAATGTRRGPAARERAVLLANMEMWRWEPRDMGERRIEVNVPDFSVSVMDGDTVLMMSRVVVGKPATPTPVFSSWMRYVLINPSWQVPDSIIKKEILPRLDHFEGLGYEVKTVGGRLVVRQPPGEDNALGRLAFMFPNDHSVYLHDTPSRHLFDEDMRALSHGCVRVEDPERLAEIVLGWPEARIEAAIGGPERTVFLPRPLPIHIEYFTAFVDADGSLEQRPDVYGLTQRIARILSSESQD
jgi:murein L,D-transpeptidase YcbB/YkuD